MDVQVGFRSGKGYVTGQVRPETRLGKTTAGRVVGVRSDTKRKQPLTVSVQPNGDPSELMLWGDDE